MGINEDIVRVLDIIKERSKTKCSNSEAIRTLASKTKLHKLGFKYNKAKHLVEQIS